ncbi:MAG: hypothetical protein LWW95_10805 [Candidatus Desulfofervidus auxilii]|nr:hypothetical protein [Candidatus Desulfofervidus auxilii]
MIVIGELNILGILGDLREFLEKVRLGFLYRIIAILTIHSSLTKALLIVALLFFTIIPFGIAALGWINPYIISLNLLGNFSFYLWKKKEMEGLFGGPKIVWSIILCTIILVFLGPIIVEIPKKLGFSFVISWILLLVY